MKFWSILLGTLLCLNLSCTKSPKSEMSLKDQGPYPYIMNPDPTAAATFEGEVFTFDKLTQQSPLYKNLKKQENEFLTFFIYRKSRKIHKKETPGTATLAIYLPGDQNSFHQILARHFEIPQKNLSVEFTQAPANQPKALASFQGQHWTRSMIETNHIDYAKIQFKIYEELLNRLNSTILRWTLLKKAKAAGTNIETFINDQIITDPIQIDKEDLQQWAIAKNISKEEMNPAFEQRLRSILQEEKRNEILKRYLRRNLDKKTVKLHFEKPSFKFDVEFDYMTYLGKESAKDRFVVFTDLHCKTCKKTLLRLLDLPKKQFHKSSIGLGFFYTGQEREEILSAEAAMCIKDINPKLMPDFIKASIQKDDPLSEREINEVVGSMGIDTDQFRHCFLNRKFQEVVNYHTKYIRYLGIQQKPMIFHNGEIVQQPALAETIKQAIINSSEETLWKKITHWCLSLWNRVFH